MSNYTIAPAGTPCEYSLYKSLPNRRDCAGPSKDRAIHVLTENMHHYGAAGTALCGYHSPYDVQPGERESQK